MSQLCMQKIVGPRRKNAPAHLEVQCSLPNKKKKKHHGSTAQLLLATLQLMHFAKHIGCPDVRFRWRGVITYLRSKNKTLRPDQIKKNELPTHESYTKRSLKKNHLATAGHGKRLLYGESRIAMAAITAVNCKLLPSIILKNKTGRRPNRAEPNQNKPTKKTAAREYKGLSLLVETRPIRQLGSSR